MLCIVFIFCLVSCQDDGSANTEESSAYTEPVASFETVKDFKIAIKKNPTSYIDKRVLVKGYMDKLVLMNTFTRLSDVHTESDELKDPNIPIIEVFILDPTLRTVVEDGDYIEICGTVSVSDGEICLKDCTYTMITTNEERR